MSVKLTNEEAEKAADALFNNTKILVEKYKSGDMNTNKILGRVGVIAQFSGITRTTAFGALAYAATMAPVVGLSKETLIGFLSDLYDVVESDPSTPGARESYAKANAEFHAQQEVNGGKSFGDFDFGGATPVPGSKLKH